MLAVVTVVAVFVGYHVNWIRQRHALKGAKWIVMSPNDEAITGWPVPKAPGLLWLFGEEGVTQLTVEVDATTHDAVTDYDLRLVREARRLFPEAMQIGIGHNVFGKPNTHFWYSSGDAMVAPATRDGSGSVISD